MSTITKACGDWKFVDDGSTMVDLIGHFSDGGPMVYHFAPQHKRAGLLAAHPYDDSYEASICEVCKRLQ